MPDTLRLRSFDLATQDVADADLDALHRLSISVGWPHRQSDWELLRSLGRGLVALDEIGRVFSSAMWFEHGPDCATIGMVITSPRVQTHGGGRWMMDRLFEECGERRLMLNSTRAAYPLYLSLGFQFQAVVCQMQGIVQSAPPDGPDGTGEIEAPSLAELPDIVALDAAAFGAERQTLLSRIAPLSRITGMRRRGRWAGYAMRRPFGRGHVIGPVIAESEADAIRLVAPLLADLEGQFARLDTRQSEGPLRSFLERAGLGLFGNVKTLARGASLPQVAPGRPGIYGLAGHALS